jgi:formylglycine-generating enzyme required for sulfatase activity
VTGDFDGDRHTDLGAYHEGSGLWFLADIAGNVIGWWISWGGPGYQPVAKDYNGDERAELAVYQSTTGLWYIRTVGGTILEYGLTWGGPGYTPVP